MDITKLSITELKALGFDMVAELERTQQNLRTVNAELAKRQEVEVKEDKKK